MRVKSMDNKMESRWVTPEEIAKFLNVSVSFLCNNRNHTEKEKVIPYSKLGSKVMYNIDTVDKFVKEQLANAQQQKSPQITGGEGDKE